MASRHRLRPQSPITRRLLAAEQGRSGWGRRTLRLLRAAQRDSPEVLDAVLGRLIHGRAARGEEFSFAPALCACAETGDEAGLLRLLRAGADPDEPHPAPGILEPRSALAWAARFGHTDCVRRLLESGANAGTPLVSAAPRH